MIRQRQNRRQGSRRPAGEGLRPRSRRGALGGTWWSRRFVAVLESMAGFAVGGRLSRGRDYARSGNVLELTVRPGVASARVQGSEPLPYYVRVATRVLEEEEWQRVEAALASRAGVLAGLLDGKILPEIEQAFAACGLSLFPTTAADLETECSCPDPYNPCKHALATCYILAEQFDADPFLLFTWRGRSREQLLEHLGTLRAGFAVGASAPPLAGRVHDFWRAGKALGGVRTQIRAAEEPDAVLRALGPAPAAAGGESLVEVLAPAYRVLAEGAARLAATGD